MGEAGDNLQPQSELDEGCFTNRGESANLLR